MHHPLVDCTMCGDRTREDASYKINREYDFAVCSDCAKDGVVPQLLKALQFEANFPPTWGDVTIEITAFLPLLPADFYQKFSLKSAEYATPLTKRVYCKGRVVKDGKSEEECGAYMGRKILPIPTKPCTRYTCEECETGICAYCSHVARDDSHICTIVVDDDVEGLRCPNNNCRMLVELIDGCNAMKCSQASCGTQFCVICGEVAGHNSDHWAKGKPCPRFGKKGDPRAIFDEVPEDEAPEGEEGEDEDAVQNVLMNAAIAAQEAAARNAEVEAHASAEHQEEFAAIRLPAGLHVDHVLANWFASDHSQAFVRDENYIQHVMNEQFPGGQRAQLGNIDDHSFLMLLNEMRFAYPTMTLWRAIGVTLSHDEAGNLFRRYQLTLRHVIEVRHMLPDEYMARFSRIERIYERFLETLLRLIGDIGAFRAVGGVEPPNVGIGRRHIPIVEADVLREFVRRRVQISGREIRRLQQLHEQPANAQGGFRFQMDRMGAAGDFLRFMDLNLRIPAQLVSTQDFTARWNLLTQFLDQSQSLDHLHEAFRDHFRVSEQLGELLETYNRFEHSFKALFTEATFQHYRRGWHPNGRPNGV